MALTSPLVLPADLVMAPVAELGDAVRARLGCEPGDFAISRPGSRTPSRVVDAAAAELLRQFVAPRTIVEAVVAFSQAHGSDAEQTLEDAFPLLQGLWQAGFLVEAGSAAEMRLAPTLAPGDPWGEWEVAACVQVLEDVEVLQLRRGMEYAALKIVRPAASPATAARLLREAVLLARLAADGRAPAPRLLACGGFGRVGGAGGGAPGKVGGRSYLVLEWCEGVDASVAAAELRQEGPPGRRELLRLCHAVAAAYARLHECGVLHGDVHPRNVLVGVDGAVRLIDFDLAVERRPAEERESLAPRAPLATSATGTEPERPPRGGVGFFFEPEYARAVRAGEAPPPASAAGEQHAVAALLHLLVTGAYHLDFALGREEMLRQIAEQPPASWEERGLEPWPLLEAVLARALAKSPAARFANLDGLVAALDKVAVALDQVTRTEDEAPAAADSGAGAQAAVAAAIAGDAEALLERTLESLRPEAPLYAQGLPPPRASVAWGAAGIACALYRMALARQEAPLLALADLWAVRACADAGHVAETTEAFFSSALGITPATVGSLSLYHGAAGPHAVQALVAHAMGETAAQQAALAGFAAAASAALGVPGEASVGAVPRLGLGRRTGGLDDLGGFTGIDLALGRSGLLLGAALLLDTTAKETAERVTLTALGEALVAQLWRTLDASPPIAASERPDLGMAHGWAGYLYATLLWRRAAGGPLPAGLRARLAELAACGERWGRGRRWRWFDGDPGEPRSGRPAHHMPGWCNGSAGFVFLWTAAHQLLAEPLYGQLALGAAWNAWEEPEGGGTLCCGLAGRSYALLHLFRHYRCHPSPPLPGFQAEGLPWLERARRLAERAARDIVHAAEPAHSLHKGALGVAVLAAELAAPDGAAMPLFAAEGWDDPPSASGSMGWR